MPPTGIRAGYRSCYYPHTVGIPSLHIRYPNNGPVSELEPDLFWVFFSNSSPCLATSSHSARALVAPNVSQSSLTLTTALELFDTVSRTSI